jgi:prephenate dehydrogenase
MGLAATEEADEPEILLLAAGGFRDLTRLAASNPALWSDILVANREAVGEAIELYVDRLRQLADLVREGRAEEVERAFDLAKRARLTLAAKPQVRAGVAVLQVPVPDRPGVLAELTSTLAEAGVNIEDLQIVHSPEGGRGTVHLTVAAAAAEGAAVALVGRGFDPTRVA